MFVDEAKIEVRAGKGGDGIISFRRGRYAHKGGPDGGDGGNGGSIWVAVSPRMTTLSSYRTQKLFKAENGQDGGKNNRRGKSGEDLILEFPKGTIIKIHQSEGKKLEIKKKIDLIGDEAKMIIANGGKGGHGNDWYKSSVRQAPKIRQRGRKGEELVLSLELKLLADVGLIGMPNAGKSTLLSRITHARPKIAAYPFTTKEPNLGILNFEDLGIDDGEKSLVIADIPGLIEGASKGKGLGDRFLRHIERCKIIIHLVDGTSEDVARDYRIIMEELKEYSYKLVKKKQIVVLNKIDALDKKAIDQKLKEISRASNAKVYPISAVAGTGIKTLLLSFL